MTWQFQLMSKDDLKLSPVLVLLVAAIGISTLRILYNLFLHPLSHIPGPWYATCSPIWINIRGMQNRRTQEVHKLHKVYGPVVRVSPNLVSFLDQAALPKVYGKFPKSQFYTGSKMMEGTQDHTFTTLEWSDHQPIRKVTGPTYSQGNILEFAGELRDNIRLLLQEIDKKGDHGRMPIETIHLLKLLACDAVGIVGFGEHWGSVASGHSNVADWSDGKALAVILRSTNYNSVIKYFWKKLPIRAIREAFEHEKNFEVYAADLLEPKRKALADSPDLLASEKKTLMINMLTTPLSSTGRPIPDQYITAELVAHVSAGSDTSGITTSYILWALTQNPEVLARLQNEVDEAMGPEPTIDLKVCKDLEYLEACVQEGLRLFTSAPSHLERQVPPEITDLEIAGYHIPPGTTVATQGWSVHRDPAVFAEPERYWPDRWLSSNTSISPEIRLEMQRRMMPFGLGTRICVGRNLAGANIRMTLAALVHNYDIAPAKETTAASMEAAGLFILAPKSGECRLHFRPRKVSA